MEKDENQLIQENDNHNVNQKKENSLKKTNKVLAILLILAVVIILIMLVWLISYVKKNNNDSDKNKSEVTQVSVKSEYKMSGNELEKFNLAFLKLENKKENKLYSPLSIKYALGMLSEGAKSTSKAQIDAVIGDYSAKKYINNSNMSFANAIFIRDTYKDSIKSTYINTLNDKYNAEVIYDSFKTADTINSWAKRKTFNLIDNLYSDMNNIDFALVNALAIDMEWVNRIQSNDDFYTVKFIHENFSTNINPFIGTGYHSLQFDNSKQTVKSVELGAVINKYDIVNTLGEEKIKKEVKEAYEEYLKEDPCGTASREPDANTYVEQYIKDIDSNYKHISSSTDFYFYDNDDIKVFAKDLKEYNNTTLQYIGIMPKKDTLDKYIENMDSRQINNIIKNLKDITMDNFDEGVITKINGYIPMFNFNYELDLKSDLQTLGIKDVFDPEKTDISGLTSNKGSYIDNVSHKSSIEFSNEGIKAAAATVEGGLGDTSCGFVYNYDVPVKNIDLTFDNPYLFLIRDKNTGEVWFVGTVYEPIENERYK